MSWHDGDMVIVCDCGQLDHAVRFTRYDGDERLVFVQVALHRDSSLRQKLLTAWRYLRNRTCRYTATSEIVLNPDEVQRLIDFLMETPT